MFIRRPANSSPAADTVQTENPLHKVWRHRQIFGAVFCGTLIITVIALFVVPVRYSASGSVIVAEQEPSNANASAAWAAKIGDPADVESQLLIVKSPRIMRLALDASGIRDAAIQDCFARSTTTSTCEKAKEDTGALVDYIAGNYSIGGTGRSRVISIGYTSPIAEVSQKMANALTNAFLDDQRVTGANSKELAASYLWKEAKQLDAELRDADAKIQAFRRNKGLARGQQAPIWSERLTSISQQLANAENARAEAAARLQEIKSNQARAIDSPAVQSNRSISDLKQQLTVVTAQLANQSNSLGPRHPSIRALEQEQAAIRERINAEVASTVASAQKNFESSDALVKSLTKQMDDAKAEVGSATSEEATIESLARNTEIKRTQYADLYRRASELETERRVLIGSTRLVSLAELPMKPFFPKKIPFIAAGATLALLLASFAAFFGDSMRLDGFARGRQAVRREPPTEPVAVPPAAAVDTPVAPIAPPVAPAAPPVVTDAPPAQPRPGPALAGSSSELSVVTGAPILARLPAIKRDAAETTIGAILSAQSGAALARSLPQARDDLHYQDALRDLAARLLAPGGGKVRKTILVASPSTAEGKTFLTLSLAQHLAAAGRNVLVIESDLGAPKLENALGLRAGLGLQGVLRGEITPREAVVSSGLANLDTIPAGPVPASAELLMRQPLADVLQWARTYDVVLVDAPSPGIQTDIGALAKQVDGVLLCMRSGRSSIGQAVATSSAIRVAGGELIGIAITMVPDAGATSAATTPNDVYAGVT
ncbi:polysaccharide biosynthesis tyrosine autokinase [Tardiphaga sp.]|jgi:succinoglycan biosynthesis transport protein ExoP|uniref:polysaccharide biosynthesis tyrosine autokinase n=1 Tax=Tardiphaga sp. TaxID=1926292 RepID=UPI0037D9D6F2